MPSHREIAERVVRGKPLREFTVPLDAEDVDSAVEMVNKTVYEHLSFLRRRKDPRATSMERLYQKTKDLYQLWKDINSRG